MAVTEERFSVPGVKRIILEGRGEVLLEQGEQAKMTIRAEDYLLAKLKTEVRGGRLELGFRNMFDNLFQMDHPTIQYHIIVPNLEGFSVVGSGTVRCPALQAGPLELAINGSGTMRFEDVQAQDLRIAIPGSGEVALGRLESDTLEIRLSGSGRVSAAGQAKQVDAGVSGSGKLRLARLQCQRAQVRISGSGSAELDAQEELEIRISGSGEIRYAGQPAIRQSISGSGRVRPLEAENQPAHPA